MGLMNTVIDMVEIQCGSCGVYHAIPKGMHDTCVEEGGYWHCPNGHSRGYKEGRMEREAIRLERDRLKQQVVRLEQEAATASAVADAATKRVVRMMKRAKAGICPCCNRRFANLESHMKMKHGDVDPNVVEFDAEKRNRA